LLNIYPGQIYVRMEDNKVKIFIVYLYILRRLMYSDMHIIYLGTNFSDVNNATPDVRPK
jgi:hypothetical protein